jgi:hypothetical protein
MNLVVGVMLTILLIGIFAIAFTGNVDDKNNQSKQ